MNEKEELVNFVEFYMRLRQKQTKYFKFKIAEDLKDCKIMEQRLDAIAQKHMIDLNINFSISPEQPKLF